VGTISLNDALENIGINTPPHRGEIHLTSPEDVNLNDDGITWVKVPNMVGNLLTGFSVTTGTLKKTISGGVFVMNGVSDLEVNKACKLFYGLALNGSIVSHEVTPHTFSVLSKVENISITALAELSIDDEIEIWIRGDGTNDITVTIPKLDVTFVGE